MRAATLLLFPLAVLPSMAIAQDHQHGAQAPKESEATAPSHTPTEPSAGDGSGMDHDTMDHGTMDHSAMNHGTMGHGTPDRGMMEHGPMGHSGMEHSAMPDDTPIPQGPPPPDAFEGPAFAADAFVGAEKMAASRASVVREVSGLPVFWFQADRAEYRAREGKDGYLWDVQGYYGGDLDKFWFKSEGEGSFGEKPEAAEVQGLWSHAIGPWWDLQVGARQDLAGPERTYAVVGVQGLAPYLFEVDTAAFLSTKGDLTARIEAELDQRITQRLILQPRVELNLSAQDIPELGIGAGLDTAEVGLRLRYEFAREFAPYLGIEQEWKLGGSADYARLLGEGTSATNFVIGVRFWF
ncbi:MULTISPECIES: copper resistance protein B [Sphingomonadales]|nr:MULTISPECIES: copper resistance protein B [Sphingomonadales]KPL67319.1 copper resistance protein CopB [Erythrobacter sp. SG61-1L]